MLVQVSFIAYQSRVFAHKWICKLYGSFEGLQVKFSWIERVFLNCADEMNIVSHLKKNRIVVIINWCFFIW